MEAELIDAVRCCDEPPCGVEEFAIGVALNALRGLAVTELLEPGPNGSARPRVVWPATRRELVRLLDD